MGFLSGVGDFIKGLRLPSLLALTVIGMGVLTLTVRAGDILSLMAAAAESFSGATTTLYLTPYASARLAAGETVDVDVNVNTRVPINAIGATITFPTDLIEIVGFSKKKSFLDLWTEETAIKEDAGEIHFSGGTFKTGGMVGNSTVLTLSIRAKHPGRAILSFKDFEIYPDDGTGEKIISESHSAAFDIASTQRATIAKASPVIVATATIAKISDDQTAPTRSMDVNTDGFVNILDVSIMVMRLLMPYDFHFDINSDGSVNVADVTAVLNAVR